MMSKMEGPVLALMWMDKKAVHATVTYTQAPARQLPEVNWKQRDGTIEKLPCPKFVSSYSTYISGVDKNGQMKWYYPIPVAGKKWWSRVFYNLIDRSFYNSFVLEQQSPHHAKRSQRLFQIDLAKQLMGIFVQEESVEGHLMSIYWLGMLRDISLTFSKSIWRGKDWKGDAKFVMMKEKSSRLAIIVLTVMLAFVPHLALEFTISHRHFAMSKGTHQMVLMCIWQFLYFKLVIYYHMSTFWFYWVEWHVTSHDKMLSSKALKFW